MEYRRILVGADFSAQSESAIARAFAVARRTGALVVLAHVADRLQAIRSLDVVDDGVVDAHHLNWPDHLAETERRYHAELALLGKRIGDGLPFETRVVEASPDEGLVALADTEDADLVVVGSHGRTGLGRFLMGSVAERVVRLTPRSVLVARNGLGRATPRGFSRILVATDFTALAERAMRTALDLAEEGARIDVLHCWHMPPFSDSYFGSRPHDLPGRSDIQAEIEKRGAELLARTAAEELDLHFYAFEAPPALGIQQRLEKEAYDLVVTGSHGRRGVRRFIIGSVAEVTVRHAPCSALVVHAEASAAARTDDLAAS